MAQDGLAKLAPNALASPGDVIAGKYRVEQVIGAGGMGVVVRATHLLLEQPVAVKLLTPAHASNPEAMQRFLREARASARIRDEHAVRTLDVGQLENGTPFIVMELLQGEDLGAVLKRDGPLPVGKAVNYLRQACIAIAEAHEAGIVHRDLKPSNLFRVRGPAGGDLIKVLDFGISKNANEPLETTGMTRTGALLGSPFYMPPEQMRGVRELDHRADIWSLGVSLFELLTGTRPFDGESLADLAINVVTRPPKNLRDLLPDAPELLAMAIGRALEKDPGARFARIEEFTAALAPFDSDPFERLRERRPLREGQGPALTTPLPVPELGASTVVGLGPNDLPASPGKSRWAETLLNLFRPSAPPRPVRPEPSVHEPSRPPPKVSGFAPRPDRTIGVTPAPWRAVDDALPISMRPQAEVLRAVLANWFDAARAVGGSVVALEGDRLLKDAGTSFFAVFLEANIGEAQSRPAIGGETFMSHAEPLARELGRLETYSKKLIIAFTNTPKLGKGGRERIASYQEKHSATVVPLFIGDVVKAHREDRVDRFLRDRLFDLHPRPNLFSRRSGPPDTTRIVGLETAIGELVGSLKNPGAVLLVAGAPGCGKSSLIEMAEDGLEAVSEFKKIACGQVVPRNAEALAREVMRALEEPPRTAGTALPSLMDLSSTVVAEGKARNKGVRTLVLDDADWLVDAVVEADDRARDLVTALAQQASVKAISLLVTGYSVGMLARRRMGSWHNPLAPLSRRYPLPPLHARATERLVGELGLGSNLRFAKAAVTELHAVSGGNVDVLLRVCSDIVESQRRRADEQPLAIVDVSRELVLESIDVLSKDAVAMEGGALDLLDDTERKILETIALHRPLSLKALQLELDGKPERVARGLKHLQHMELVSRTFGRIRVKIPLLETWLVANVSAEVGEAKRNRARRLSFAATITTLGLCLGAVYFALPSVKLVSVETEVVELEGCHFRISRPEMAGPGDAIGLHLVAQPCKMQPASDVIGAAPLAGTVLSLPAGKTAPVLGSIGCFGGFCSGDLALTIGETQSGPIALSVVTRQGQSTPVNLAYDDLSLVRRVASKSLSIVSGALTLVGVGIGLRRRIRQMLKGRTGSAEGQSPPSSSAQP